MTTGRTVEQNRITSHRRAWRIGDLIMPQDDRNRVYDFLNAANGVAEARRLTVDTYSGGATYTWTLLGFAQEYTESGDVNEAGVAAKIAGVILADPFTAGMVFAEADGANVNVTDLRTGRTFTLTTDDGNLTASLVTAASEGTRIPVGRVVLFASPSGAADDATTPQGAANSVVGLARTALVQARTYDLVVDTNEAGVLIHGAIHLRHVEETPRRFVVAMGATADDTVNAINAAITALGLPAGSVSATPDTGDDKVTVAAATAGYGFTFEAHLGVATTGAITVDPVAADPFTDVANMIAGIALLREDLEHETIDGESTTAYVYPVNALSTVAAEGMVAIPAGDTNLGGGSLFLGLGAGEEGVLFGAYGAGRVPLPSSVMQAWRRPPVGTTEGAVVRVASPI